MTTVATNGQLLLRYARLFSTPWCLQFFKAEPPEQSGQCTMEYLTSYLQRDRGTHLSGPLSPLLLASRPRIANPEAPPAQLFGPENVAEVKDGTRR